MTDEYIPEPTPETARFWEGAKNGELWIQRCLTCGKAYFYPRPFCPNCNSDEVEWFQTSGRAKLVSYIISQRGIPGLTPKAPYIVALVQLEEGPSMASNLVGISPDPESIQLDMPLQVTFQSRGEQMLPVFQPEVQ